MTHQMKMSEAIWRGLERHCGYSGHNHGAIVEDFSRVAYSVSCVEPIELIREGRTVAGEKLQEEITRKYGLEGMLVMAVSVDMWKQYCLACQLSMDRNNPDAGPSIRGVEDWDVLGSLYMQYGHSSEQFGQFFTPWEICYMMAKMTIKDDVLTARMQEYFNAHPGAEPLWQVAQLTGAMQGSRAADEGKDPRLAYHLHLAEQAAKIFKGFNSVSHLDCCIGSGRTLLAAAAMYPPWAIWSGMVTFAGTDIDYRCVRMSRSNLAAFGCKGTMLDWTKLEEAQKQDLKVHMPAAVKEMYEELETIQDREALSHARLTWQMEIESEGQQILKVASGGG